ncbi:MAG: winged helix-turn-helix domain-containing protein [Burkholderiaceae bacterium]
MLSEYLLAGNGPPGGTGMPCPCTGNCMSLRRALLEGKLPAGERLPSSRDLAQDLALSRNTVVAAINQLSVEATSSAMWAAAPFVND